MPKSTQECTSSSADVSQDQRPLKRAHECGWNARTTNARYIANSGDTDLVFLEMFKNPTYQDISLPQRMAHTPHLLVNQPLQMGTSAIDGLPTEKVVLTPAKPAARGSLVEVNQAGAR